MLRLRSPLAALAGGLLIGALTTAGALLAQAKKTDAVVDPTVPFDIVDTPGSTYLLNRSTGQVWRISFTDVGGNKYWYALHVPVQQPGSFEDFQTKLRREMGQR
ncbi:MAG: hypothetical protein A2138_15000 [Deltaproteobacteria bacterium RBG_16_71_12]|nr:MAG: hypothetical protein A2138_15000 [Deltaproteobacteria bacterium RBG_16_71_12]